MNTINPYICFMNALVILPENNEQAKTVKAVLKAMNVKFKQRKQEELYDPEFTAKIRAGEEEFKSGRGTKIPLTDLWN